MMLIGLKKLTNCLVISPAVKDMPEATFVHQPQWAGVAALPLLQEATRAENIFRLSQTMRLSPMKLLHRLFRSIQKVLTNHTNQLLLTLFEFQVARISLRVKNCIVEQK
jgi:hypothetical protein